MIISEKTMITRYGLHIPKSRALDYIEKLPGKFYKILPIYEGRDYNTREKTIDKDVAYNAYQKYLYKFSTELCGFYYIFPEDANICEVLALLEGMKQIKTDSHEDVKTVVFECIDKAKKILEELKKE